MPSSRTRYILPPLLEPWINKLFQPLELSDTEESATYSPFLTLSDTAPNCDLDSESEEISLDLMSTLCKKTRSEILITPVDNYRNKATAVIDSGAQGVFCLAIFCPESQTCLLTSQIFCFHSICDLEKILRFPHIMWVTLLLWDNCLILSKTSSWLQ
jgi:hypothetical protein